MAGCLGEDEARHARAGRATSDQAGLSNELAELDPYKFMAVIGKRVIHPGGRASTEVLLRHAAIAGSSRVLDVGGGVVTDEGLARCLAVMGAVASRPAHMRKIAWPVPRRARAVPYLGYIVVAGS
jgi:hypothetical protein